MIYGIAKDASGTVTSVVRLDDDDAVLPDGFTACDASDFTSGQSAMWNTLAMQAQRHMTALQQKAAMLVAMGSTFTVAERAYVNAIQAIAIGTDTTSTALPADPNA